MEFNKEELEKFAVNIAIRCSEASPSKYKQIRMKVKEIIDEFWDEKIEVYKRPLGQRKDDD